MILFRMVMLLFGITAASASASASAPAASSASSSRSTTTTTPTTPLGNHQWDPSWIASSGQGTLVVALSCQARTDNNDKLCASGVLLLIQTPKKKYKDWTTTTTKEEEVFGLTMKCVLDASDYCCRSSSSSSSGYTRGCWHVLSHPPSMMMVCAMTGFLPDVDYLHRRMRVELDQYDFLYQSNEEENNNNNNNDNNNGQDVSRLAQSLGSWVREHADRIAAVGRPLGIQALLIGWSRCTRAHSCPSESLQLRLYTTDPSGQVRSWNGGGTAIGKNADQVRKQLQRHLVSWDQQQQNNKEEEETPLLLLNPRQALEIAIKAVLTTQQQRTTTETLHHPHHPNCKQHQITDLSKKDEDSVFSYDAILIWKDTQQQKWWIGQIDPSQIIIMEQMSTAATIRT